MESKVGGRGRENQVLVGLKDTDSVPISAPEASSPSALAFCLTPSLVNFLPDFSSTCFHLHLSSLASLQGSLFLNTRTVNKDTQHLVGI